MPVQIMNIAGIAVELNKALNEKITQNARLSDKNLELQRENDELQASLEDYVDENYKLSQQIIRLESENRDLRQRLEIRA